MKTSTSNLGRRSVLGLLGLGAVALVSACADGGAEGAAPQGGSPAGTGLTVYKDPTCGCCGGWIEHAEEAGYTTTTVHPEDLDAVFAEHDVPADLQSCHLTTTASGALFVGHVPIRYVRQYLADPPAGSRGLTVPGMPVGSPGMEQGDTVEAYEVLLLMAKGEPTVFAEVAAA